MKFVNEKYLWQLNDEHSIRLITEPDCRLKIELHSKQVLTHEILLNDRQCSVLTHRLCETTDEFQHLLVDLLTNSPSSVTVKDSNYLHVEFPVYFGCEKTRSKQWSFEIVLADLSSVNEQNKFDVSLDPKDWTEMRLLGRQIMDDMIDYLRDIRLRPTWQSMPDIVRQTIRETEIPWRGQSPWKVYEEVCSLVLPYPVGNIHPHYYGYVQGTGSSMGVLADLITGTMNTMSWGGHQASIHLERQVLSWLKVLMGFPDDETSSGVLVSGTSVATIIAVAVARKKFLGRKFKVYMTKDTHSCVLRAVDLLDLGRENVVYVPTNAQLQIDIEALEAAIDPDTCGIIVGTAGSVGTGAVDDFLGLARICTKRPDDLWFHIDGAIGAVARCSEQLRPLFAGFEHADSIAFDLHKWLCVPYECGCILIRDGELHRTTFSQPTASYLTLMNGGITPSEGEVFYSDYGLELSRNMKSLKVWMTLKTYGIETFGQVMEKNVHQVKYFAQLIEQNAEHFEVLTTGPLNIVCFRCIISRSKPVDLTILNQFNKNLLVTIQERGIAVVSPMVVQSEKFALRMCITNQRTKMSDMDLFMGQLLELMKEFLESSEYSFLRN